MKQSLKNISRVIDFILKGFIFLLPIYFLPWTATLTGMDNYNKQILLLLCIPFLVFLLWFIQSREEKFALKYSFLDYFIMAFWGIFLAATIFSVDRFSSVFGAYSYITQSLIALTSYLGIYFLVTNYYNKKSEVLIFFKLFLRVYNFVIIISSVIVLGYSLRLIASETISVWFKSSLGTTDDLAMFIAVMNVLVLSLLYSGDFVKEVLSSFCQKVLRVTITLSFVLLMLINFTPAWISMFVGILVFLFLKKSKKTKVKINWKNKVTDFLQKRENLWLALAIVIPLFLIVFNSLTYSSVVTAQRAAQKLQAGNMVSLEIARQTLMKRPVFGYGPETYSYAYSLLRPVSENLGDYWYLRFNHGASYVLDLFITTGFFGAFSYLVFLAVLVYLMFMYVRKIKKKEEKAGPETAVISVLVVLLLMQFYFSMNTVLLVYFWFMSGLFIVMMRELYVKSNSALFLHKEFFSEVEQRVVMMVIFMLFFVWVLVLALSGRYFAADYYFKKSLNENNNIKIERYLQRAIKLNPYRFNYQVAIAKYYKEAVISEMAQKEKDIELVKSDIGNSIYWAKSATKLSPYSVVAYETLGAIYRDLSRYIKGDDNLAVDTFRQALAMEPSNPVLASELGNTYLSRGLNDDAAKWFQYSYNLRNDNYEAVFGLAKIMISLKQEREAMDLLQKLEKTHPTADVYYEEGKLLYNLKNFEHAIVKFQQTISVSPLHANALYSLGLALEANGETEAALHYFKKVSELNPNNNEVKEKIKSLEN